MKHYLNSAEEVIKAVDSNPDGLSASEADKRLAENGKNKLAESKKESLLHRFFKQLCEPMTIILLVAAAISAGVEIYEGIHSGHMGFPSDVVIILAVVLINAVLGVLQESKAEKAIAALQEIAAATSKVIRDGKHGLVDETGRLVIPCQWKWMERWEDGKVEFGNDLERYRMDPEGNITRLPDVW